MFERIAEIRLRLPSAAARASNALDRAAACGFNAVFASDADTSSTLPALGAGCIEHGLALWVALAPDAEGLPHFCANATPLLDPWLVSGEDALDPRRPPLSVRLGAVEASDALIAAWTREIGSAIDAGVVGFICRDADRLPSSLWRSLFDRADGPSGRARWFAWTPGLPPAVVRELISAGFDGVCSSLAWWDDRSAWLLDERQRQHGAMQLGFPIDPFAPADVKPSTSEARARLRRRLWVGAVLSDALLVPASVWDTDTSNDVPEVNGWLSTEADRGFGIGDAIRFLSGPDAPISAIVRANAPDLRAAERVAVVLVNPDPGREATMAATIVTSALSGFGDFRAIALVDEQKREGRSEAKNDDRTREAIDACATLRLAPGAIRIIEGRRLASIKLPTVRGKRSAEAAIQAPRIAIEAITPSVDGGRFPVKRIAGDAVRVEADIIVDGHEKLAAALMFRAIGDREWREVRMEPIGNDRFAASFPLLRVGRHEFAIEAWRDVFATYRDELEKKAAAGLDVSLEIAEGRLLVAKALARAKNKPRSDFVKRLTALSQSIASEGATPVVAKLDPETMAGQVAALLASQTLEDMHAADAREFAMRTETGIPVDAERIEAGFASWYELFPRSQGNAIGSPLRHGTFDDVFGRLPAVRAMGFDVLYFTPIHPIGKRNRKGRNNSLVALENDPGSPYAIGSADGGHDALHPELGTFEDFKRLREAALANGLELALDFAIQCSPDHPWLKEHPGWFAWRPDGSLRYAENPPKKYEDIVNVDFYGAPGGSAEAAALWTALRDVILSWVEQGVRIFRVDNPHTKPLPFWEWMINDVRAKYPDTIFLSEAFTRPKVMYRLAKVGFSQSYTYFTWRHTKQEFIDYLTELTTTEPHDFFRPHFFVNTPDINPVFLQRSGRAGFLIRAALAATLSGLWGVYSGFELCEATPVPGKEEYFDSEKYEIRAWDWERPGNIVAEITALNRIRALNPALHTHLNVRFHNVFDPNILYFAKATEDRSNIVLVAINLDPHGVHEADFEVPLWDWSLPDDAAVDVTDLLGERRFRWQGKTQRMRLDPTINPYAIWRVAL